MKTSFRIFLFRCLQPKKERAEPSPHTKKSARSEMKRKTSDFLFEQLQSWGAMGGLNVKKTRAQHKICVEIEIYELNFQNASLCLPKTSRILFLCWSSDGFWIREEVFVVPLFLTISYFISLLLCSMSTKTQWKVQRALFTILTATICARNTSIDKIFDTLWALESARNFDAE